MVTRMSIKKVKNAKGEESWSYDIRVLDSDGRIVRRRDSGFATRAECERAAALRKHTSREIKYGVLKVETNHTLLGDAVERYLSTLTARWEMEHGNHYVKRHVGQLNALRRWVVFVGADRRVASISNDDLVLWAQHEAARTLDDSGRTMTAVSIRRRLNDIRAALWHAQENNDDLANYRIPRTPRGVKADVERARILEDAEIAALAAVLSAPPAKWRTRREPAWRDAYDFLRVALATAGRCSEVLSIKWTDVNFRFGSIRLVSTKSGGRERTLHAPAAVEVIRQRQVDGLGTETHVFDCNDHSIRDAFRAASKICGIQYGQRGGWSVHDLRRTSLSNLLMDGVPLSAVRDFAGHSSIAQTSRYVHPSMAGRGRLVDATSRLVQMASTTSADCVNSVDCVKGSAKDAEPAKVKDGKKIA